MQKNKYHYEVTEEFWPNSSQFTLRIESYYGTKIKTGEKTWTVNKVNDFDQIGYITCNDLKTAQKLRRFFETLITDEPFSLNINNPLND